MVGGNVAGNVGGNYSGRLLEPIGNIPPAEAEANDYAQIDEAAMVA